MMFENQFNASIRGAIKSFQDIGFWRATVYPTSLPRSQEFNSLSLASQDYVEVYEAGLALSHYNFLLSDFSYFQFSFSAADEFALAYYPNPRLCGSTNAMDEFYELEEALNDGDLSEEEFAELLSTAPAKLFVPRIRFEYSAAQFRNVRHPGAHFHIGMSGEDRWASSRKVSPKTFSLVIAKHYYPQFWWPRSRFSQDDADQASMEDVCLDQELVNSLQNDGVSPLATEEECEGLHFSARVALPAS